MYEIKDPLWQFVDHWQTLIAGLLAVAAGAGTIWVTIKSATREVTAAQDQTKAAQQQSAAMREIERRRLAREGCAFHAMLEAAMGAVIEDVGAARKLPPPRQSSSRPIRCRPMPFFSPCWLHTPPDRVYTHAAPVQPSSQNPPTLAVFPIAGKRDRNPLLLLFRASGACADQFLTLLAPHAT